jgi:hypothetical protein
VLALPEAALAEPLPEAPPGAGDALEALDSAGDSVALAGVEVLLGVGLSVGLSDATADPLLAPKGESLVGIVSLLRMTLSSYHDSGQDGNQSPPKPMFVLASTRAKVCRMRSRRKATITRSGS